MKLIMFWNINCEDCKKALLRLNRVYRDRHYSLDTFIGIIKKKPLPTAQFLHKKAVQLPQYWDNEGEVFDLFEVEEEPFFLLVDEKNNIRDTIIGFSEENLLKIRRFINKSKLAHCK